MRGLSEHHDSLSPTSRNGQGSRIRDRIISITLLLLLASSAYLLLRSPCTPPPPDPFHWKQCAPHDAHYLCGYLTVPLDYTNASDARVAHIATKLYQPLPGRKSDKTLIIEPGGPGASGTAHVERKGKLFSEWYTGGEFDVLGFDPRGVNLSSPAISCFPKDAYRDRWAWAMNAWPEVRGYRAMEELDAMYEAMIKGCHETLGDLPRFVSTAFVARDVDAIREALGEQYLTAFMVSYGTEHAQTYAQMFPDRVGSLALDGTEYVAGTRQPWQWGSASLDNVTDAFEHGFIAECVRAGHPFCSLAESKGISPADETYEASRTAVSQRVRDLVDRVKHRAIPGTTTDGPGLVTYEHLVHYLFRTLYKPASWAEAATVFSELEAGNATLALEKAQVWSYDPSTAPSNASALFPEYSPADPHSSELFNMVVCVFGTADTFQGDVYDHDKQPLSFWKQIQAEMLEKSWISGSVSLYETMACRHFDWDVAEVYRGRYNHTLANPILVIGSPYDPATPLRTARDLAEAMGQNARLIVSHGYGHSSTSDPSACTNALVRAYMVNGTLPTDKETDCYADQRPFDGDYSEISAHTEQDKRLGFRKGSQA